MRQPMFICEVGGREGVPLAQFEADVVPKVGETIALTTLDPQQWITVGSVTHVVRAYDGRLAATIRLDPE